MNRYFFPKRLIVLIACMPGATFVALGEWPEFFLWLGGTGVAGWIFVVWLNKLEKGY
ncbi:MAG: hypothetical protein AAF870_02345 [Pseudomonadota bacterium]